MCPKQLGARVAISSLRRRRRRRRRQKARILQDAKRWHANFSSFSPNPQSAPGRESKSAPPSAIARKQEYQQWGPFRGTRVKKLCEKAAPEGEGKISPQISP